MKPTYEQLEQQLEESRREFRAADATIQNLEQQLAAVVAENAGLKDAISCHAAGFTICEACGEENISGNDDVCRALNKTPATDAHLAKVRASGIDEMAAEYRKFANKDGCSCNMRSSYNLTAERAESYAAYIRRQGAAHE